MPATWAPIAIILYKCDLIKLDIDKGYSTDNKSAPAESPVHVKKYVRELRKNWD